MTPQEKLKQKILSRGGELLSPYERAVNKVMVKCHCGHVWWVRPYSIRNGQWCPRCAGKTKNFVGALTEKLQTMGYMLVGEYRGTEVPIDVLCNNGHLWQPRPHNVLTGGARCCFCAGKRSVHPNGRMGEAVDLVAKRGGHVTSTFCRGVDFPIFVSCGKHPDFKTSLKKIKMGRWCPYCSLRYSDNPEGKLGEARIIIETRGGKMLSVDYFGNKKPIDFICENGHMSTTNLNRLKTGSWCKRCVEGRWRSRGEMEIFDFIKNKLPDAQNNVRGLFAQRRRMELDVYVPSLLLGFEFNGTYWHSLQGAIEKDSLKRQWCEEIGIKLVIILEEDWSRSRDACLARIDRIINERLSAN